MQKHGSVYHQWKISWHFQMHLLGANLWFQRKMTPDERDVLPLGSNRKVGGMNIQFVWRVGSDVSPRLTCSHSSIQEPHPVVTLPAGKARSQGHRYSCRCSSPSSSSSPDRQTDRQMRATPTGLCQRWCVLCVKPQILLSALSQLHPPQTYGLTSDDFADALQSTSHVLIPPPHLWRLESLESHICSSLSETTSVHGLILRRAAATPANAGMVFSEAGATVQKHAPVYVTQSWLVHSPNYLCQTSQNNYYMHIFIHIRVSHSLLLHSYISAAQLSDTWHIKQPKGLSSGAATGNRDHEWLL